MRRAMIFRSGLRAASALNSMTIGIPISLWAFSLIIAACWVVPDYLVVLRTWLAGLGAITLIWGWICFGNRGKIPLRSDVLVCGGFTLSQLFPPLYLSFRIGTSAHVDQHGVADMYPLVSLVTAIGAMALLIGYNFRRSKPSDRTLTFNAASTTETRNRWVFAFILALFLSGTWIARVLTLKKGVYYWIHVDYDFMFSRYYSVLKTFSGFGLIVVALLWVLDQQDRKWRPLAWLATATEFAWILPSGARLEIVKVIFLAFLISWQRRRRLPIIVLVVVAAPLVFMMPTMGIYRYTIGPVTDTSTINVDASLEAYRLASERVNRESEGSLVGLSDNFLDRLNDGQFLGFLLKHFRSIYEWEYGRTYFERIPYLFLPYFVYTARPIMQVPINQWYSVMAGGSAPTTFLGEAYINFGYFGVTFVSLFMGVLLGYYDRLFFAKRGNPIVLAIFLANSAVMPYMVTQSLASWMGMMRNALLLLVAAVLFEKLEVKGVTQKQVLPGRAFKRL
jgi:hypothetical protein